MLKHIGFIMDGNGRWAKAKNKTRIFGHREGAKRIPEIILEAKKHNISEVSFFAFSTENWKRPKTEVNSLILILRSYLNNKKSLKWFQDNDVKINFIGFENKQEYNKVFKDIKTFCNNTKNHKSIIVNICFNYGSQLEIINACNKAIANKKKVNEKTFNDLLMIKTPVDLLIRTSGEQRISNFLLWQLAYSEIIFEPTYWPDYKKDVFNANIKEFNNRIRRYGGIDE